MSSEPDYLREAPDDLHPALVGAVWRGGPVGETEVAATLTDLADRGIVTMERIEMQVTSALGPAKLQPTTQWRLDRSRAGGLGAIDAALVALLFDRIARDETLTAEELAWQARERPAEYRRALLEWIALVDSEACTAGLLRPSPAASKGLLRVAGTAIALAGLSLAVALESWVPAEAGLVLGGLVGALSFRVSRLTAEGKAVRARYQGLHDFLRDFSDLEHVTPEHFALWRRYLVLALVLGVAQRVADHFDMARPGLARDPRFTSLVEWVRDTAGGDAPVRAFESTRPSA